MADEAPKKSIVEFSNSPKVGAAVVAAAATHLLLAFAKQHGYDITGQEPDILIVVTALIGYLVPHS